MSTHKSFRKLAVTNGLKTTNLIASASLTNSYNLTLPSAVPTLQGQSLISDTSGNLSWGSSIGVTSTFTGTTNPLSTATNVTGLVFTGSYNQTTVYVAVNATTNIYSMYLLRSYQKGSTTSWGLNYDVDCDTDDVDPQVVFTITTAGQIQYTLPNTIPGFTSVVMMWSLGAGVASTLTSLALSSNFSVAGPSNFTAGIQGTSLALSSILNVSGATTLVNTSGLSLLLGNASSSGSVSSAGGSFLTLQSQTYTDSVTAASSTATGNFSATYLGIPTLAAANTAVTTGMAATLTIAGPPVAGTNETLTNTYALNVVSGSANFGGNITIPNAASSMIVPSTGLQVMGGLINQTLKPYGTWKINTAPTAAANSAILIAATYWTLIKGGGGVTLGGGSTGTFTLPLIGQYIVNWMMALNTTSGTYQALTFSDGRTFYNNVPAVAQGNCNLCMTVIVTTTAVNTSFYPFFNCITSSTIDTTNSSNTIGISFIN